MAIVASPTVMFEIGESGGILTIALGHDFDCIDPRGIKREVLLNVGDCFIRFFIRPNGIFRFRSADGNAVLRAIAFVRTIGVMRCPNEQ